MNDLSYGDRLNILCLYSVKGRLLRADLNKYWKMFLGKCVIKPDDIFTLAEYTGTRRHRYKIVQFRADMECRRRFFSMRRVVYYYRRALTDTKVLFIDKGITGMQNRESNHGLLVTSRECTHCATAGTKRGCRRVCLKQSPGPLICRTDYSTIGTLN